MKSIRLVGMLLTLALLLAAYSPAALEAKSDEKTKLSLTLACHFPRESMLGSSTKFFEEELIAIFGNRLKLRSHWGGSLFSLPETITALQNRVVDISSGLWLFHPGLVPLGDFEFGFWFNDPDYRTQAKIKREMFDTHPALKGELAKHNIGPPMLYGPISTYPVFSRQPINSLPDMRGKKIGFAPSGLIPFFRAAGMVPVLSPAVAIYERLERGVVDAATVSAEIAASLKWHELTPYIFSMGEILTPTCMTVWVNMDMWKSLSESDQNLFIEAGRRAEARYIDYLEQQVEKAYEEFAAAGITITKISESDFNELVARLPNTAVEWAEKMEGMGLPGWEVVDLYVKLSEREGWKFPYEIKRP